MVLRRKAPPKPFPIPPSPSPPPRPDDQDPTGAHAQAGQDATMASSYGYGRPHDDGEPSPYEYYPTQGYPISNEGHQSVAIDHDAAQPPSLGAGHAPQLSESFYSQAAAALDAPQAGSSLGHSPFSDSAAPAAHLPTLLRSPYDGSMPGVDQGGSTPSSPTKSAASPYYEEKQLGAGDGGYSYGYGRGEAQYAGVGGEDSPRSSLAYDDKTELEHTPGNPFASIAPTMDPAYMTPQQYGAVGDADEETTLNAQDRYAAPYGYGQGAYEGTELHDEGYTHGQEGTYGASGFEQDAVLDTQHFGPAPPKGALLRRHKTKKQVKLTQGNLVLDCPVPTKLLSFLSRRGTEEFESMRYTAATCDPDEFAKSHFSVRPAMYSRHTEIFICITLYNEDEVLFTRTLHGVMKNIAHLCSRHKSRTWGPEGWKKVVVAIVADGRKKVHPRVLDCLAALGVYQEGVAKNVVNGKVVQAHIYEYTTQLSIDSNLQFKGAERGLVPMQIIFCLKEHNAKKINSHRWFFNAFGPVLQPNVCVLIDAGTRPENKSIYYLWKAFDLHSNVAGACGEICADTKGKWGIGKALLNPLIAAQNFEYKISNILDKTTESVFGYITVLPGAFSAYRYLALQNDDLGRGPLASYFKGEKLMGADADVFTSNMYLAEDRILCFELAAKRGEDWVLRYVRRARGVTDVPETLPDLIAQRRRWLNGSFFAAVYSLWHFRQFFATGHTTFRKVLFGVETTYQLLNMLFAWFSISLWGLFFIILTRSLESPIFHIGKGISWLNDTLALIYFGTVISCFVFALGNRPATSKFKFIAVAAIFAALTVYMMIASILCIVKIAGQAHDAIYAQMCIALLSTFGTYVISSIIALDPLFLITSFPAYILMAPSWINILNTYAFANLHDFTWGNRPDEPEVQDLGTVKSAGQGTVVVDLPTAQQDVDASYDLALDNLRRRPMIIRGDISFEEKMKLKEDYYKSVRSNVLLVWLLSNGLLAALILGGDSTSAFDPGSGTTRQKVFMLTILIFMAATSLLRLVASTIYEVWRWIAGS